MSATHRSSMKTAGGGRHRRGMTVKAAPTNAISEKTGSTNQSMAEKKDGKWEGIWAGLPTMFNADWSLDLGAMETNIKRMIKAGVQGIYLLGSTGEFYALEFDEFKQLTTLLVKVAGGSGIPLAVNCGTPDTRTTLRKLEYIKEAGVNAGQFIIPYWMELTERELIQFFKDVHSVVPNLPLIHYNIPRAKRFLLGPEYARVREVMPNLVAVKFTFAGSHWGDLQEAIRLNPGLELPCRREPPGKRHADRRARVVQFHRVHQLGNLSQNVSPGQGTQMGRGAGNADPRVGFLYRNRRDTREARRR